MIQTPDIGGPCTLAVIPYIEDYSS